MYVLGVDVGGSKTACFVSDEKGNILAKGFGGPGNHQVCGIDAAKKSMETAVLEGLDGAGLSKKDITYALFGISGADGPEDFRILKPAVKEIMGDAVFHIVNDTWLGLRAGTKDNVGVVSICGTGAGHAGRNRAGQELALRNLYFETGNLGGGGDLYRKALHFAFRSQEGTWEKTRLEEVMPSIFDVCTMDEVCEILNQGKITKEQKYRIPIAVFSLAKEGDAVSGSLISQMGYEEGKYAAAVLKRLHMCEEAVPAVLIGSLFQTKEPLLVDAYLSSLWETAPGAYAVIPDVPPVMGAVAVALDFVRGRMK